MRGLTRLPVPQILLEKGDNWLQNFLESGKSRPDSSKYAHETVKAQLKSMSFHKCFYCESKLTDLPKEIDHHVEVSIDKTLAFIWENLYLSCDNCNNKLNHAAIPITEALDPCRNTDKEIQEHITFKDECITAVNNSSLGLKTIQKYRLNTELLDKRRINLLKSFYKVLDVVRQRQIADSGRIMSRKDIDILKYFTQDDQPYSLMFKVILSSLSGY